MRLLFLTQDFPPATGGIQTYALQLASRLVAQAAHFTLVAPHQRGAKAVDAGLSFPVYRPPRLLSFRPDTLALSVLPWLPGFVRREQCDVAFHAQWPPALASVWARRQTGYPRKIVVAAHGRELLFNPFRGPRLHRFYAGLRQTVLDAADAFLPVSHYTAGLLQDMRVPAEKITVIFNGTDPNRLYPVDVAALRQSMGLDGRTVLLTLARLVPRKGIDTTLRALRRIAEAVPSVCYLIAGEGPDRARLEALADAEGVAERVRFLGRVSDDQLLGFYNLCDVFVMPARNTPPDVEGFGIVFLEANACAKPVVGARAGGVPDAIQHGHTGLLTTPGDEREVAEAVLRILQDPSYARQLGHQGRQRILDEASWDHIASRVYASLGKVMG